MLQLILSLTLSMSAQSAAPEADRAAILAMAGDYEVTFQFKETTACTEGYQPRKPYETDATESVRVIEDRGDFISLQHILVLDGGIGRPPKIVKHWRQDWTWQDTELLEFRGRGQFERRSVSANEARGQWSQAVYQVTDQPRYEALGRWNHVGETSTWVSEDTWRPLPRREKTKRDDYQVVLCRNIHTITAGGWLHEQLNQKVVLDEAGQPASVLVLEHGHNSYRHSDSEAALVDFSEADRYWNATKEFWAGVRDGWATKLAGQDRVMVADRVDGQTLARAILAEADAVYEASKQPIAAKEAAMISASALIARAVTAAAP